MRRILEALTVFNWIGPALSVADQVTTGATRLYYPMGGKYSGRDIVRELGRHGIGVRLLTRMVVNDCYVFSVERGDVDRAREILGRG